jgi:hypothetical protein
MSEGRIALFLTVDEALVLEAFLTRGQDAGDDYSSIEDQAELRVLWDMAALLEAQLPVANNAVYARDLASARAKVRDSTG